MKQKTIRELEKYLSQQLLKLVAGRAMVLRPKTFSIDNSGSPYAPTNLVIVQGLVFYVDLAKESDPVTRWQEANYFKLNQMGVDVYRLTTFEDVKVFSNIVSREFENYKAFRLELEDPDFSYFVEQRKLNR